MTWTGPLRGKRSPWLAVLGVLIVSVPAVKWAYRRATNGGPAADRKGNAERAVPVQATAAFKADIQLAQTAIGTVTPRQSVTVRSRVSGQLIKVAFHEGDMVCEGQVLAEIDPRPFQVQLTQIEGQTTRDQALLDNALLDQGRYRTLTKSGLIAAQQADAQDSLVRQYQGSTHADRGLLESAQLELSFTRITAPASGRIGLRLVDAGNNVTPGDATGIAVINTVQPITVVFAVPEDNTPAVVRAIRGSQQSGRPLRVEAWDRGWTQQLATGKLLTIDNQIDPTTGTVKLKGEFANDDGALFPNQFVNVRVVLGTRDGATLIPSASVQRGSSGPYVYVATPEKTASLRAVVLGPTDAPNVAVDRGVAAGELVVTSGADQLREGIKVAVTLAHSPAAEREVARTTPRTSSLPAHP